MDAVLLRDVVAELFASIHALSGYAVADGVPEIHAVPVAVMQRELCGKPCPVKAYFHPDRGIFLDETLDLRDSAFDRSVLLHELVHYLQKSTGRFEKAPGTCLRNHLSEVEAYDIQNRYLSSVNSPTRALYSGWTVACRDEGTGRARRATHPDL
ncbi:MAG TPA: hypothetical protein VFV71_04765 [Burkholderiales bacterium]|nr:hypothetical protein [Burkholderiales bacterium]